MSTGNNPVPDIRREDHSRPWCFFDRSVGKISREKRLPIAESHTRPIRGPVDNIIAIAYRIVNRLGPGLAVEFQLKPLVVIDRFQKLIRDVYRDVEVRQ